MAGTINKRTHLLDRGYREYRDISKEGPQGLLVIPAPVGPSVLWAMTVTSLTLALSMCISRVHGAWLQGCLHLDV